jgi:hypothetical protein
MICENCLKETSNPKFCCQSCSSQFNNRLRKKVRFCAVCQKQIDKSNKLYCSRECSGKAESKKFAEKVLSGEFVSTYSSNALRKFLISLRGYFCESCLLNEWLGMPIPLNIHHIDGDASNNNPTNLQLLW